jgi:hypothetical protein
MTLPPQHQFVGDGHRGLLRKAFILRAAPWPHLEG